jgi:8-oxo-dGTP pyrophosphatase MutT (NUDIX family)
VPSGSLDGNQDPKQQLLQELNEEAGICVDDVSAITYIGLFYSSKDHCYDLGYLLSLHSVASTVQSSAEYTQLAWMTSQQVSELLHSRRRIVPLSKQLLSLMFS